MLMRSVLPRDTMFLKSLFLAAVGLALIISCAAQDKIIGNTVCNSGGSVNCLGGGGLGLGAGEGCCGGSGGGGGVTNMGDWNGIRMIMVPGLPNTYRPFLNLFPSS